MSMFIVSTVLFLGTVVTPPDVSVQASNVAPAEPSSRTLDITTPRNLDTSTPRTPDATTPRSLDVTIPRELDNRTTTTTTPLITPPASSNVGPLAPMQSTTPGFVPPTGPSP